MKPLILSVLLLFFLFPACNPEDDDTSTPETVATCSDGIQNGDETGIDCGGDCPACTVAPPTSGTYLYGVADGETILYSGPNGQGSFLATCDGYGRDFYQNGGTWQRIDVGTGDIELLALVALSQNRLGAADPAWFYDMYGQSSYTYEAATNCSSTPIQAAIFWVDEDGTSWSTEGGDQTGSTFEITERGPFQGYSIPIKGRFSCKVYSNAGEMKTVESGQFSFVLGLF
ncbi:MAG: hypothetical protein AAFW73_22095 [Bacteroidota bacterium]